MSDLREELTPVIEEVASLLDMDPAELELDELPGKAMEAAAYAYGRVDNYSNLRRYVRKVSRTLSPALEAPVECRWRQLAEITAQDCEDALPHGLKIIE